MEVSGEPYARSSTVRQKIADVVTSNSQRSCAPHTFTRGQTRPRAPSCWCTHMKQAFARLASNRDRLHAVSILTCAEATAGLERESMQVHRMTSGVVPQSVVLNTACERMIGWCCDGVRWRCRASPNAPRKPISTWRLHL